MQRVSLVMYMFCFAFDMLLVVQKGKQHSVFHLLSICTFIIKTVIPSDAFYFHFLCYMYYIFEFLGECRPHPL